MIDGEDAGRIVGALCTFGGGLLAYLGRKSKKPEKPETEDEANARFIQDQLIKVETERDQAIKEGTASAAEAVENLNALHDIISRLCYMLAVSDSTKADFNRRQIMMVVKYRSFTMKDVLLSELEEIFGVSASEINLPPGTEPASI